MFSSKGISRWTALACMMLAVPALAADKSGINIKQVQVGDNARVDLLLDNKISDAQIRTEFINDIIQLSLSNTSVYPAKISSISGQELTKIFVYQYAPGLVRVRLTVKGKAESYQGKLLVRPSGKMLTVSLGAGADQVVSKAAQTRKKADAAPATTDAEERALLDRILNSDKPAEKVAEKQREKTEEKVAEKAAAAVAPAEQQVRKASNSKVSLGRTDELINPWKALTSFVMVMVLLGACVFGLKKIAVLKGKNGALSRLITKSLGRPAKMIDVVATHYLGPKKSIHVVKVAGRTLVLGVSDGSINLITEFAGDITQADIGEKFAVAALTGGISGKAQSESADSGSDFLSELGEQLAQESGRPASQMGSGAVAAASPSVAPAVASTVARSSARDRIRSRLEGMKQL